MNFVLALLFLLAAFATLIAISIVYEWMRRKTNRPKIGLDRVHRKLLRRGDYVNIDNRILCFSHITGDNEIIDSIRPPSNDNRAIAGCLAFDNPHSLGYIIYPASALRKCKFIYGRYGLKWAASEDWANSAEEWKQKNELI